MSQRRGLRSLLESTRCKLPGSALSVLVAVAAAFVSTTHGGPQYLYALFIGVAFHFLSHDPKTKVGIEFCAKTILRLGVGLLGARITAEQIIALGLPTALTVVFGVATTILLGFALARRLGLTSAQGVLSGGAVAICGASAALAISAVLPRDKDGERFTLMVVVSVTVMSTIAMVVYPLIARTLHLPPQFAGLFIGGSIHDVAQVVGAGYSLGQPTGDVATIVKLFRISLLAVVVVLVSASFKSARLRADEEVGATQQSRQPLVPWFLWLFVAMVATHSAGLIPSAVQTSAVSLSQYCLVTAIAALGMKTSFQQLAQAGWRPMLLIATETVWIAVVMLVASLIEKSQGM